VIAVVVEKIAPLIGSITEIRGDVKIGWPVLVVVAPSRRRCMLTTCDAQLNLGLFELPGALVVE
jgi:hypothetical protein